MALIFDGKAKLMSFEAPDCSGAEPLLQADPLSVLGPSDGAQQTPVDVPFGGASETVTFKGCGGPGGLRKEVIKAFVSHQRAYSQRRRPVASAFLVQNKVCFS